VLGRPLARFTEALPQMETMQEGGELPEQKGGERRGGREQKRDLQQARQGLTRPERLPDPLGLIGIEGPGTGAQVAQRLVGEGDARARLLHQQEKGKDQARIGEPDPAQAALDAEVLPKGALSVNVDAGHLAGHAGTLLTAVSGDGAAHRLGDLGTGSHVGGAAQRPAQAREHGLHGTHRADVLAPGLASPGPTHQQRRRQGEQQQDRQTQRTAIHRQQSQAKTCNQQAPLKCQVVAAQPGILVDHHHLEAPLAAGARALPAQGPGQLRHEGQRTDAPPELMADGSDQQQPNRHHCSPEEPVAGETLPRPERRQSGQQQRCDQQQPTDQQRPAHEPSMAL
jgi:hypothetical protein